MPGLGSGVLVTAGREVLLDPKALQMLLGGLDDSFLCKEVVVALERQLCSEGPAPPGQAAELLQDHSCFRLLLHSLELLGTEKAVTLSILRWVWGDRGVWGPLSRCVSAAGHVGETQNMFVGPGGVFFPGAGSPQHVGRCRLGCPGAQGREETEQLCQAAGGDMQGQQRTCLGAGGVCEVPGQPWFPLPERCLPGRGRESGLSLCPGLNGPLGHSGS